MYEARNMHKKQPEFLITIYADGAQYFRAVESRGQAEAEIAFLRALTGQDASNSDIKDGVEYFFMLEQSQMDAYSDFMKARRA